MSNDGRQDQASGKLKKTAGKVTGDDQMRSEGETQETKGDAKRKVEKVTDKVKGAIKGGGGRD